MKPLFFIFALFLYAPIAWALSIDIQSAKESGTPFSIIHIKDPKPFICQEALDEFRVVTQIECYFDYAPPKNIQTLRNPFFTVKSFRTPKLYVVHIVPSFKMKLFTLTDNLAQQSRIIHDDKRMAMHWMVVGFKEVLPLIASYDIPENGLNFPIDFHRTALPSVGALGIDGKPIELDHVADVSDYMDIRRFFAREQYDDVLRTIEDVLFKDPNTIFKSELLLYKMRTQMILDELGEVVDIGKQFLREFSSDEALPEVLYNLAFANAKMGMVTDAEYFYDRLLTEHYDSEFATRGLIALGEHIMSKGDVDKALYYFKTALEKAQTKELASQAAMKLTNYYLAKGDAEHASYYIQKIAQSNLEYLLTTFDETYEIAKEFAERERFDLAAQLASKIWEPMDVNEREYEPMMYQIAVWLDQAGKNEQAYELYKTYAEKFPFGEYFYDVEERMDKVLFKIGETNTTKQLELYKTIEEKYYDQDIAKQALFNKAQLLFDQGSYKELLKLETSLKALDTEKFQGVEALIGSSAKALVEQALDQKGCQEAIVLVRNYDLNLSKIYAKTLYDCTMQESEFAYAHKMSQPFIQDGNITQRLAWMVRHVKAAAKVGDHKTVFVMAGDIKTLGEIEKSSVYDTVIRDRYLSALALAEEESALALIGEIQTRFGVVFGDIELYVHAAKLAHKRNDDAMIEVYAQKVMDLQAANRSYTQSPAIEYMMLQALKKLDKAQKTYEVARTLSEVVKTPKAQARALYELGNAAQKIGKTKEAKEAYTASAQADETSPWAKLSADSLKLLP